jgi:hypothetical protein
MHSKTTHERRQHAVKVATGVTAVLFVGWLATLGLRLSGTPTTAQNTDNGSDQSSLANVVSGAAYTNVNTLQVASSSDDTTTDYGNGYTSINSQ